MKPSALGLILPVTAGWPCRSRRNPAGQHKRFILWGKWRLIYKSHVLDSLTDKLFIVYFIYRMGSLKTWGSPLTKIGSSSHCFFIFFANPSYSVLYYHYYTVLFSLSTIYLCTAVCDTLACTQTCFFFITINNDFSLSSLYLTSNLISSIFLTLADRFSSLLLLSLLPGKQ